MIPVTSSVSSGLTWSERSSSQRYELKRNDEVVGTLRQPSFFSASFVAETPEGHWTFRRSGLLGSGTEILESDSQQRIAAFKSLWGGRGALTFADGQKFHLECKGLWRPVWSVTTESGQVVLHLHTRERCVDVPNAAAVPERRLSLLIMFTLYRVEQAEQDAASAAMVAS